MSIKTLVRLGLVIGSTPGGYIPTFCGASILSFSTIFGSLIGVWAAYKMDQLL